MPTRTNFKAQIEWRSPDSVKPYGRNNKKHTESTIKKLADKIRQFGWDVPIVVDGSGVIIKGHRRHQASLLLKLKQVPVIVRTDLSREEVRAARLADNRLNDDSLDDMEAIAAELADLDELDFDLDLTGYDEAEIEKFLGGDDTEYQSSESGMNQGNGGSNFQVTAGGEGEEEEGGDDDDTAVSKSPQEKYPLAIVLTWKQKQDWDALKVVLGVKKDTDALLKIMELGVVLK